MSRGEEVVGPLFDVSDANIESWRDDSAFVEPSSKVDDDLATSMVINDLELSDVPVLHHHSEEADYHLGRRSDEDLPLATLLGVIYGLKGAGEGVHQHHDECLVSALTTELVSKTNQINKKK